MEFKDGQWVSYPPVESHPIVKGFQPYDRILVRMSLTANWTPRFFGWYNPEPDFVNRYPYVTTSGAAYPYAIPYTGNEHLTMTNAVPTLFQNRPCPDKVEPIVDKPERALAEPLQDYSLPDSPDVDVLNTAELSRLVSYAIIDGTDHLYHVRVIRRP
jgi:hypothetical protein